MWRRRNLDPLLVTLRDIRVVAVRALAVVPVTLRSFVLGWRLHILGLHLESDGRIGVGRRVIGARVIIGISLRSVRVVGVGVIIPSPPRANIDRAVPVVVMAVPAAMPVTVAVPTATMSTAVVAARMAATPVVAAATVMT